MKRRFKYDTRITGSRLTMTHGGFVVDSIIGPSHDLVEPEIALLGEIEMAELALDRLISRS